MWVQALSSTWDDEKMRRITRLHLEMRLLTPVFGPGRNQIRRTLQAHHHFQLYAEDTRLFNYTLLDLPNMSFGFQMFESRLTIVKCEDLIDNMPMLAATKSHYKNAAKVPLISIWLESAAVRVVWYKCSECLVASGWWGRWYHPRPQLPPSRIRTFVNESSISAWWSGTRRRCGYIDLIEEVLTRTTGVDDIQLKRTTFDSGPHRERHLVEENVGITEFTIKFLFELRHAAHDASKIAIGGYREGKIIIKTEVKKDNNDSGGPFSGIRGKIFLGTGVLLGGSCQIFGGVM
ncbi:hypothetical protein B0H13DRAFT_2476454 [Mycena leptocephala]|nr:hypothetical protein B0H13DRAFT_2476454 [Mycena leptocephala]